MYALIFFSDLLLLAAVLLLIHQVGSRNSRSMHQGCEMFHPNNGMQCTVIALALTLLFVALLSGSVIDSGVASAGKYLFTLSYHLQLILVITCNMFCINISKSFIMPMRTTMISSCHLFM